MLTDAFFQPSAAEMADAFMRVNGRDVLELDVRDGSRSGSRPSTTSAGREQVDYEVELPTRIKLVTDRTFPARGLSQGLCSFPKEWIPS